MNTPIRRVCITLGAVVLALAAAPETSFAQQAMDSRWLPWLGCWQASAETLMPGDLLVCVRPASGATGVEIATVAGGDVASVRTLAADGERHDLQAEDCSGWQSASFSSDGRRVFAHSELTCEGGVQRAGTAIMAMASPDEWLDAQSIAMGDERAPRVLTYRPVPPADWPPGFAPSPERAAQVAEARILASAELSMADVEEAATRVAPEALVAFLIERDQQFELDASSLVSLADAGVPEQVIDVLVAVSYPHRFAIDREAMTASFQREQPAYDDERAYDDPFGWGWWGGGRYGSGGCYAAPWGWWSSSYCSPFSYGALGFGYGLYDPFWFGSFRPIIVVRGEPDGGARGRAVPGRGYTRGGGSSGDRFARPRDGNRSGAFSPSVRSGGGSPSRGGAVSRGGYSSGKSGSSSGRTAKPKSGNK